MAITVTKEGFLPGERPMQGKCTRCKTEVECQQRDAKADDDGRNGTDYTVLCPLSGCGGTISVFPKP